MGYDPIKAFSHFANDPPYLCLADFAFQTWWKKVEVQTCTFLHGSYHVLRTEYVLTCITVRSESEKIESHFENQKLSLVVNISASNSEDSRLECQPAKRLLCQDLLVSYGLFRKAMLQLIQNEATIALRRCHLTGA